uniref:Uncharacterized protein LOC105633775 n=1 Tax=Rhizophora mucronata TaxID=61149 RepID=A0A2P2MVT3_RHIMU
MWEPVCFALGFGAEESLLFLYLAMSWISMAYCDLHPFHLFHNSDGGPPPSQKECHHLCRIPFDSHVKILSPYHQGPSVCSICSHAADHN